MREIITEYATRTIGCPLGTTIDVNNMTAMYGRIDRNCSVPNATAIVKKKCQASMKNGTCMLRAYDSEFGGRDPCRYRSEQLRVNYSCKNGNFMFLNN